MASQRKKQAPVKKEPATARSSSIYFYIGALASLVMGLYHAIKLSWVCDDAFITFRYVKNFVDGNGIVYNIGERVEGYTHFLWLLILSGCQWLGFEQVNASMVVGIICFAILLVLYIAISAKEARSKASLTIALPLAALLLSLNYDMNVWASGGLETSLYTLLLSSAFYVWFYSNLSRPLKLMGVGKLLTLATLSRPEGALFIILAVALLAIYELRRKHALSSLIKDLGLMVLPVIVIGIPYLLWKYNYYGDLLPNTFYTKSAGSSYFGQGFFYIWLFFRVYFTCGIALLALGVYSLYRRNKHSGVTTGLPSGSPVITAITAITVYLILYVAQVGGDFMFARFIIPILPLMYYLIERGMWQLTQERKALGLSLSALLLLALIGEDHLRENVLLHVDAKSGEQMGNWDDKGGGETHGIADERWVYMRKRLNLNGVERSSMDAYSEIGQFYEPFFRGLPITIEINGAQNMIAYYANFRTVINEYGLTDSFIAHQPINLRGRIGHEKTAPDSYLVKRGVQFQLFGIAPKKPDQISYDMVVFELPYGLFQVARMITYDKEVMAEVQKRFNAAGLHPIIPHYERILPKYVRDIMPKLPLEQVVNDYGGFKQLYLNRYKDTASEHAIQEYIEKKQKQTQVK